ncbi:MAG: arabinogalactan endo-1,4-beta-galactosidase [Burkholderiaceae bacterium]|nr:arabinogalactan endo-1,4-beta-galactosidase [Burkholderiaceae bacterium]
MKHTTRGLALWAGACLLALSTHAAAQFANGADVSWVNRQEAAGYRFYDAAGVQGDPFVLLKNLQVNAIRLRVWVNPADGWNNGADVLYKAKRAAAQGQRIMIDFHYSDTWADPGKQTKPAAWAGHTLAQLKNDVYQHTSGILTYLKNNGIAVEWVQVGNEINGGMLWPEGSTSNFSNLAGLINQGYNASKAVYPNAKVIVHLANGYKNADFRWFFDNLKTAGGKWDVTGMSHYPPAAQWASYNSQVATSMNDMVARYSKPVMICEVGMDWQQSATAKSMMADLLAKTRALGSNGLGVFYWEPQAYPGWEGYTMGAVDASGKFTAALDPY